MSVPAEQYTSLWAFSFSEKPSICRLFDGEHESGCIMTCVHNKIINIKVFFPVYQRKSTDHQN